jgi:hypothetical protein
MKRVPNRRAVDSAAAADAVVLAAVDSAAAAGVVETGVAVVAVAAAAGTKSYSRAPKSFR